MEKEKRLIDASLLLQWVEKLEAYNRGRRSCKWLPKGVTPEGVRHMIDTMPTVDAVEVVRCKACDWYRKDGSICVNPKCGKSWYGCRVPEQHYCSYGERKDNGC